MNMPNQTALLDFPAQYRVHPNFHQLEEITLRIYDHDAVNLRDPAVIDNMVRASLLFTVCFYGNLLGCLRTFLDRLPSHPFAVQEDGAMLHLLLSLANEELATENIKPQRVEVGPHYVFMLEAAQHAGIDTSPIEYLIENVEHEELESLMVAKHFREPARAYMLFSDRCARDFYAALSTVALRELSLGTAFTRLDDQIPEGDRFGPYKFFLQAHVELDSEDHGPLMQQALLQVDDVGRSIDTMINFYTRRLNVYDACLEAAPLY